MPNDYLVKSFVLAELEARVRTLMRRNTGLAGTITLGDITLMPRAIAFTMAPWRWNFPPKNWSARTTPRWRGDKEHLLGVLSHGNEDIFPNAVEMLMHRLRKKLEGTTVTIRTLRGLGIFWKP